MPKDPNRLAHKIVQMSAEETTTEEPATTKRSPVSEYLSRIGRNGGLKGGRARAEKLSHKRKVEIAKKAAQTRWATK